MQQPYLPKYVASTLRLMCFGILSGLGLGGLSKNAWKYLVNCLLEILVLVNLISCSMEMPEETHLTKRLKYLRFLAERFFEIEKYLLQDLHLNLQVLCLSNPQEITFLEAQNLQAKR